MPSANTAPVSKVFRSQNVMTPQLVKAAYRYCRAVTRSHYENFPVASLLLPARLRPAIEAIYAFSRLADDFADEPEYQGCRLQKLDEWEHYLDDQRMPTHPVFIALHDSATRYLLPKNLFHDLITAFRMDVVKKRYQNFDEVLHYCQHSANPVGRLVLHLFGYVKDECLRQSDCICTALQLANFWQDVDIDLDKDRIYLPQDDLALHGVTEAELFRHQLTDNIKRLLCYEIERAKGLFREGKPLGLSIPGSLGIELRLTWLGGVTVLKKIEQVGYDVFRKRPALSKADFAKLLWIAISRRRYENFVL
jgi:squalene synthase HpnC